jgi:hypothetical protein
MNGRAVRRLITQDPTSRYLLELSAKEAHDTTDILLHSSIM